MPGPDVPAIAIGIMKKKGMTPPGSDPGKDAEPEHEVSPDELDGAHDLMAAMEMKDPHAVAQALCNFMDIYNAPPSDDAGPAAPGPSDAPEAG